MSEISFVSTFLLFIMSSCPNLLRVALAPSLPSSGKKLKLKLKEKKNLCPLYYLFGSFLVQEIRFFFPYAIYILGQIKEKINLPSVSRK